MGKLAGELGGFVSYRKSLLTHVWLEQCLLSNCPLFSLAHLLWLPVEDAEYALEELLDVELS